MTDARQLAAKIEATMSANAEEAAKRNFIRYSRAKPAVSLSHENYIFRADSDIHPGRKRDIVILSDLTNP